MGFLRPSGHPAKNTEKKESSAGFSKLLLDMREKSRKSNAQVSVPMDTAIIAGGLVGKNVKIIQDKTQNLHDQISSASAAIEEITASVNHFNGVVEKQDVALSQTGAAVEEMSASVDSVTLVTRQKTEAAAKLRDIIDKGGEGVTTTARAIAEVTVAINAVADVIKVINDVAAQTNLLAMNAAIEAAHAGEFGKGFAVVASEVRKLAESTTANSRAIEDSLKKIITQIKSAQIAGESAGTTFEKIHKEVDNFVGAFAEISQSTAKLSAGTGQIIHSMEDLKQVSLEISGGSREITIGANSVDSSLRGIKDFSTGLVEDMGNIEEKIYDISGAQSGIAQYIVETNKNIEGFFNTLEDSGELPKGEELFNYDLIVLMHRNWLIQLRAFLDGRKTGLKATTEDYQKCDLGRWIYGDGKRFEHGSTYKALETEHKLFHGKAGAIIQAKTDGNTALAEEKYQELMDDYHKVVSLLNTLKQERS